MTQNRALPKRLALSRAKAGARWMRIHAQGKSALWFGPGAGSQPLNRFDDPNGRFRVCYLGTTVEVCFAETFLRNPPVRIWNCGAICDWCRFTVEISPVWG
jgi:hypothetical protein